MTEVDALGVEESNLDAFHEECGVFGVYGHPEAANLAYLGLYALQHRGQESAGIVSSNGKALIAHRGMGLVADIFNSDIIGRLAKEVKAPISILAGPQAPSVSELQDLGVARVSYGSAFLKAAIGGTRKLAQEILEKGTITTLKEAMQTPEITALIAKRKAG